MLNSTVVMKYIWMKERVQLVSHVVMQHRVFCLRIAECNDSQLLQILKSHMC